MSLYNDIKIGFGPGFGNKPTKLYSLKPTDGTGDFDATRSGVATFTNKDKLIEVAPADLPRGDFSDFDCNTLLLEPESENLILWSEAFDNAVWTKGRTTLNTNQITAPDGFLTADLLAETIENNSHILTQTISVTLGLTYTMSLYIKRADSNSPQYVQLTFGNSIFATTHANFDILNGVLGGVGGVGVPKIKDIGNDWFKISFTSEATSTATANGFIFGFCNNSSSAGRIPAYIGDIASSVYIWGGGFENLSYPTTYIPTTTTTVQRGADSLIGEVDSKNFSSEKGILFAQISALNDSLVNRHISLSNGTRENSTFIHYSFNSNVITGQYNNASSTEAKIEIEVFDTLEFNKVAVSYQQNSFIMFINGVKMGEDLSINTLPNGTFDRANFNAGNSDNPFYGKALELWHSGNTAFDILEYTAFADFDELVTNFQYNIQ